MLINMFFLVNMEDVEIEDVIKKRPALGEAVRNWVIIAREPEGTRVVVHVLIDDNKPTVLDRLRNLSAFLGEGAKVKDAYRIIWDYHPIIAKHIIQCSWMAYDEEFEKDVLKRGSIIEWENTGSPIRVENYLIPHRWAE